MDSSKFIAGLSPQAVDLFNTLQQKEFTPFIVGGLVRDFLNTGEVGDDFDIELHYQGKDKLIDAWASLKMKIASIGLLEELPYQVIRLKLDGETMEFSLPRVEHFKKGDYSHSNFEVELKNKMDLKDSFSRRDFTINAMAIEITAKGGAKLHDPFGGEKHLQEKKLVTVGESFAQDPVRYLRAIRFKVKLGLEFDKELEKLLKTIPLEQLSAFYIWSEAFKSGQFFTFLSEINHWTKKKTFEFVCFDSNEAQQLDNILSELSGFFKENEKSRWVQFAMAINEKLKLEDKLQFCHFFQIKTSPVEQLHALGEVLTNKNLKGLMSAMKDWQDKEFAQVEGEGKFQELLGITQQLKRLSFMQDTDSKDKVVAFLEKIKSLAPKRFDYETEHIIILGKLLNKKIENVNQLFEEHNVESEKRSQFLIYYAARTINI